MKFARLFQEHLRNDGYPDEWVHNAISYGQLKKCIKRVQRELTTLGLDAETLHQLLASGEGQHELQKVPTNSTLSSDGESPEAVEDESRRGSLSSNASHDTNESKEEKQPFRYTLSKANGTPSRHIVPKLLFIVDAETGEPLTASLSPETRDYLHQLAVTQKLTDVRITNVSQDDLLAEAVGTTAPENTRAVKYIQIPLISDSEFFGVLESELKGLASLQDAERKKLTNEITEIGGTLMKATNPESKASRKDLAKWRELFECYIDARVFFATNEQDHGSHSSAEATKNFKTFLAHAEEAHLLEGFKTKESVRALKMFLGINEELLQCLRFQEINQLAMTKILKKFDKRTALGATPNFSVVLPEGVNSEDFSRALAGKVATEIVSVVPQLDDYLCPICFMIAYRPIRLKCGHLFCIRCMVKLQRERRDGCALCRQPVVMDANSNNLDSSLVNFLKRYFPDEVKAKQKADGKEITKETFGDDGCCVM